MFERLGLFIGMNELDLKRYLKLDIAPGSQVILQVVMIYNLIVWFIFLYATRERFHRYLTGANTRHLDFGQEFHALFGTWNRYDTEYLSLRYFYRLYLGFLIILSGATLLFFLPQTWQLAFGSYFYHLLASL